MDDYTNNFLLQIEDPELRAHAEAVAREAGGKCACGAPGVLCFDPYDKDIYNQLTPGVLCPACEQRSADDI